MWRLNQVERFFSQITTHRIRRGTFDSVRALETAIENYLTDHNMRYEGPFYGPGSRIFGAVCSGSAFDSGHGPPMVG
jgi:hypothetical protein